MEVTIKDNFRKECIKKLKFCSKIKKLKNDKYISSGILKSIKKEKVKHILLYLPLKMEVDVRPIINALRKNKKYKIYVPLMIGKTLKVVPYRLPLHKSKFNLKEANNSPRDKLISIDLAVVPIVGYDDSFRRVGFGVGFYDRFFSKLKKKPKVIFTQLCDCKADNIVTQSHDIKADYIITNKGKLWMKR